MCPQQSMYNFNSDIHDVNTSQKLNFHQHSAISPYQKGVRNFSIEGFNSLPQSLKQATNNIKQFKTALQHYLFIPSTPQLNISMQTKSNLYKF
jgi:hypothetical protein